ncbi:hypothetical protein MRX96_052517 [Rhipicephalus microplus]
MSASTDQQNAQEQPPQPVLATPVSKQPLSHDCITTNLDTLFEDKGKYTTPAQQSLLIKKAPSQALKSVTVNPERGSPLEIAKARAASRELLKIEAAHSPKIKQYALWCDCILHCGPLADYRGYFIVLEAVVQTAPSHHPGGGLQFQRGRREGRFRLR